MDNDLANWLSKDSYNLFITVSLRQAIQRHDGTWRYLNSDEIKRTAWILRDRYTKAIMGKRARLPFLVFCEGGSPTKRYHLHIITAAKPDVPLRNQADTFRSIAERLEWVYHEIDIRSIAPEEQERVIRYSLKEGDGAFIPEASYVPQSE